MDERQLCRAWVWTGGVVLTCRPLFRARPSVGASPRPPGAINPGNEVDSLEGLEGLEGLEFPLGGTHHRPERKARKRHRDGPTGCVPDGRSVFARTSVD